ncbi:hypothetical protein GCM10022200_22870 [Microbacterium awajiense]|uniref:PE domain-containing protein n=1 Tax=Microbacterium awajiense TaxID=415214 RepID=A0ABP7ARD2_9MICO
MSRWSIDPTGVAGVLEDVNVPATALGEALNTLVPALQAGVTATSSAAISQAVQEYFEGEEGPRIEAMSERIAAASSGVVAATQAYVAGDLEMAATAQSASIDAFRTAPLPPGVR